MRALLIAALAALSLAAHAAPFLAADSAPGMLKCTATGLPAAVAPTVDVAAGLCKWDLAGIPAGSYTVTATGDYGPWGASAASAPFQFVRPASTSMPAGLRLVP
jgi:hypothetical protein